MDLTASALYTSATVCDNMMLTFRFKKTLEKRRIPSHETNENDEKNNTER